MKNKAKAKGQARHGFGNVASILAGLGIASTTEIEQFRAVLEMLGVPPELIVVGGLLVAAGMHLWSWFDRAKNVGEGDDP